MIFQVAKVVELYKKSYQVLYQLLPRLDGLPISREPYPLEREDGMTLNVHVRKRSHDCTEVGLCHYRQTSWGEHVPAPDMEIRLYHASREAVPVLYIDMYLGRVELDEDGRRKNPTLSKQLDLAVFKWLAGFQKRGLRPKGGMPGPEP